MSIGFLFRHQLSYSCSRLDGVVLPLLTTTPLHPNFTLDPLPVQPIALGLLVEPPPIDPQIAGMGEVVPAVNPRWIGDERTTATIIRPGGARTLIDESTIHICHSLERARMDMVLALAVDPHKTFLVDQRIGIGL